MALQLSRGLIPRTRPGRRRLRPVPAGAAGPRLGRPYRDFAELIEAEPGAAAWAATCAPAVAVALLLAEAW